MINRIPLYNEENYRDNRIRQYLSEDGHLGLWFTRFFNQYNEEWQVNKENHLNEQEDGKKAWINLTARKETGNKEYINQFCGNQEALDQYQNRVLNLIKALKGKDKLDTNDYAICETNWHFVTGMGLPHPVENGMAWHHTLGVPFLAGSTIKGLLRAWVEGGWNEKLNREETVERRQNWFGMVKGEKWDDKGEETDDKDKAGQLIFFDAVPIESVKLTSDIMTPHYGDWYAEGDKISGLDEHKRIPADWHDPVPVPFLAVKKAKFLVTIVARDKNNDKEAQLALQELVQALQWLGAGAKTAAGYGHFVRNSGEEENLLEKKREEETAQKLAAEKEVRRNELKSDLEKEVYLDLFEVAQNEAEKRAGVWLTKMEAAEPEDAERIARQLKAFYESINKWEKPSKKKQKPKVDRVKKILEK